MKNKEKYADSLYKMLYDICKTRPIGSSRGFLIAKAKRLIKEIEEEEKLNG
ncbi:hypothetical protein NDO71_orf203 [Klebsiella phage vB_KpnM_NDO71]|nr:hypothetical protein NDO71_orf203 [Klebsiella phage vB_KpnM_NDO71]